MKITRISPLTGKPSTMDLDVTDEQLAEVMSPRGRLIQNILPNLTPSEREFVKTGYTPEDWNRTFCDEE